VARVGNLRKQRRERALGVHKWVKTGKIALAREVFLGKKF
jgi:hypothetical protein